MNKKILIPSIAILVIIITTVLIKKTERENYESFLKDKY